MRIFVYKTNTDSDTTSATLPHSKGFLTMPYNPPQSLTIGQRIKAFHPHTFGVMHWGTIKRIKGDTVSIEFAVSLKGGPVTLTIPLTDCRHPVSGEFIGYVPK